MVSSFQTSNSFTRFSIFLKNCTTTFAHSGEFNPSLNTSSDKDPGLSEFSFMFFPSFPFLDLSLKSLNLFPRTKTRDLLIRQVSLITFDKMNIYLRYNFKIKTILVINIKTFSFAFLWLLSPDQYCCLTENTHVILLVIMFHCIEFHQQNLLGA